MPILLIIAVIIIVFLLIRKQQDSTQIASNRKENGSDVVENAEHSLPVEGAYQKSWLFTYNEKDAYNKLQPIAEELGYTVFAKVRLLDLLEPTKGNPKYKTYLYKIQAKHVDFVLCDAKLVARYIIELDDNSHETENRKKRDDFVDKVVTSVGYKIIHVKAITDDIKEQLK